jgi:hypothetical protein
VSRPLGGNALRGIARAIPAALAAYELRYLLASLGSAGAGLRWIARVDEHSSGPWIVALLAIGVCLMLREISRGLVERASRPRWSVVLVGWWLLCSSALIATFCSVEVVRSLVAVGHPAGLAQVVGPGGWSSMAAALCLGFLLAASFQGAWRVLREVVRWRARHVPSARRRPVLLRSAEVIRLPAAAPLLAGWSERGPPAGSPLAAV